MICSLCNKTEKMGCEDQDGNFVCLNCWANGNAAANNKTAVKAVKFIPEICWTENDKASFVFDCNKIKDGGHPWKSLH